MTKKENVDESATETKFCIDSLRESCTELFGVSTSTFDGALYGCSVNRLTVNEAKELINKFLNKKIGGR